MDQLHHISTMIILFVKYTFISLSIFRLILNFKVNGGNGNKVYILLYFKYQKSIIYQNVQFLV